MGRTKVHLKEVPHHDTEAIYRIINPNNSDNHGMVLTNDPSFTAWGWALVRAANSEIVECGCIKTGSNAKKLRIRKGDDRVRRISEIAQTLLELCQQNKVELILSELPHGSQNASAAIMVGATTGIIQTISDALDIPIEYYSEGDSKKALLGRSSATKLETINKVHVLYDVPITGKGTKLVADAPWSGVKYIDEAVADAISVYHCAVKNSQTLKMLKR